RGFRPDRAAVSFDDAPGDGEAETGAAGRGTGDLDEALEDARKIVGRNPLAGVAHREADRVYCRLGPDLHLSAGRRVANGVADQVADRPGELLQVPGDEREVRRDP